jgi:LPS-assembly protein
MTDAFKLSVVSRVLLVWVLVLRAATAAAQIPGFDSTVAKTQESLGQDHYRLTGDVVLSQVNTKFYADVIDYYPDTNRVVATGNVLIQELDHQIAAERAEFNAVTGLGTFFDARGFAALGARADISQFGTLRPDVQFYGKTIEKIGPQTYLISSGGFTTCAQANPRWEMTSGSIKLRVDHYALLRNMLLKAKGIPVLFLPALYYPIGSEARQTGFLMPSYGSSTYRGQVISNGFFWAMGRSRDATFLHDWYSKTGQAVSGEYRYASLKGGGLLKTDFLNEKPTAYTQPDGSQGLYPGSKSFTLNGFLNQGLAGSWYTQARASYFSNISVQQRSTVDLNQTSQRNRILGGSVTGALLGYRVTGTYDRNEYFSGTNASSIRGNAPRINFSRPDRLLGPLPVYASLTNEYVHLMQESRGGEKVVTNNIDRLDVQPMIRYPFNKLTFLTVNSSLMWRNTFWSDSLAPDPASADLANPNYLRVTDPISRHFWEMSANVNGPTFVKIWDGTRNRYKHSIEPFLQVTHRTSIENARRIISNEYVDNLVGNMTSYAYGSTTRLYTKRSDAGPLGIPREFVAATIRQTYYSDVNAVLSDQSYRTTLAPSKFSPVSMMVRASPRQEVNATFRTEFDGRWLKFKTFGADGTWNSSRLSLIAGWSETHFVPDQFGKNIESALSHYLNTNTTVRFKQNRFGIVHSLNYDVRNREILQQRFAGYYNAQCCGFTAEWQSFDFRRLGANALVPNDKRFHVSVTLAGIGNVSNIFGALSGTPNR